MASPTANHACDYRRYGPARTPDWRWRIAVRHVQRHTRPAPWEDPWIAKIVDFLRHDRIEPAGDDSSLSSDMAAASSIHADAGPLRDEIEARLLAGQSFETIAARTGVSAGALEAFEAAFFSVALSLNSTDWIQTMVIGLRPGGPVSEGQA